MARVRFTSPVINEFPHLRVPVTGVTAADNSSLFLSIAQTLRQPANLALAALFGILVLLSPLLIRRFSQELAPQIVVSSSTAGNWVGLAPQTKEAFLSQLSVSERRDVRGKINYIANQIRSRSKNSAIAQDLASTIVAQSMAADFDPFFVAAVIQSESSFKPNARSYRGARGLMQLMPTTAKYVASSLELKWRGNYALTDPDYNLQLGIAYLKYLENLFHGDRKLVLVAYNWGPSNLRSSLQRRSTPPRSTLHYANTIMANQSKWSKDYNVNAARYQYRGGL